MFIVKRARHFIIVFFVLLIALFFRWNGGISVFELAVSKINTFVIKTGEGFVPVFSSAEKYRKLMEGSELDRAKLLEEIAVLRDRTRKLSFENDIRKTGFEGDSGGIYARVVRRDIESWFRTVTVNKGKSDGVREGYVALTGYGLAGRVIEVTTSTSRVSLIIGNDAATSVAVPEKSIYGMLIGNGTGVLSMDSVPVNTVLERGDMLVTSGYGGNFPPGLPVARVESIEKSDEMLSPTITAKPTVDITNLYYLYLIEPL